MKNIRQEVIGLLGKIVKISRLSEMRIPVVSGPLSPGWWTFFPFTSYWRGTHERTTLAGLLPWMPGRGESAWDIGAHFGFYSVILARAVGSGGHVAAFEPDRESFRKLKRHIHLNHLKQIEAFPFAASRESGVRFLIQTEGRGATTSHLPYLGEEHDQSTPGTWVSAVDLDDLTAHGMIEEPDFIKIDAEGHGADVLEGALSSIRMKEPIIVMSFHCPEEIAAARSILGGLGYLGCSFDAQPIDWESFHGRDILLLPEHQQRRLDLNPGHETLSLHRG